MPLGAVLRARGRQVVSTGPDPTQVSYYRTRVHTTMAPADFELKGPGSIEDFTSAIAELWRSQGLPELGALAPGLARIARTVYFVDHDDDEVSPFLYVMF